MGNSPDEAGEIIYRQKEIICSNSGANEWCNHFMCELIDLFSGSSIYNHSLGCTKHETRIPELWTDDKERVAKWISTLPDEEWSKAMLKTFDMIIDNLVIND